MEELVLKRIANVTSADALDEINAVYPDAEILSFRRIKDSSEDLDFFITRIRVSALADESDDVVLDSEDIIIEDKQHEKSEEDKMNRIVELLKEIKDDIEAIGGEEEKDPSKKDIEIDDLNVESPIVGSEDVAPLPKPKQPPFGMQEQMGTVASTIVVSRPADVSETAARLELIREFAPEYKVSRIEKKDNEYFAFLRSAAEPEKKEDPPSGEDDAAAEQVDGVETTLDSEAEPEKKKPKKEDKYFSEYAEKERGHSVRQKVPADNLQFARLLIQDEIAEAERTGTDPSFQIQRFLDWAGLKFDNKGRVHLIKHGDPGTPKAGVAGVRRIEKDSQRAWLRETAKESGFVSLAPKTWMMQLQQAMGTFTKQNNLPPIDWHGIARTDVPDIARQEMEQGKVRVGPTERFEEGRENPGSTVAPGAINQEPGVEDATEGSRPTNWG